MQNFVNWSICWGDLRLFVFFEMATTTILDCQNHKILLASGVWRAETCRISSKSVHLLWIYCNFWIFQDGGCQPSWICFRHTWTTNRKYLVVSITAKFSYDRCSSFDNISVSISGAFENCEHNPHNLPFHLHDVDPFDPYLLHQCFGQLHAPPQTGAQTVHTLLHSYTTTSPLVTIGCPTFTPEITHSRGLISKPNYLPHSWTHPT